MRTGRLAPVLAAASLLGGAAALSSDPPSFTVSPSSGTPPATITLAGAPPEPAAKVSLLGGGPFLAGAWILPEGARSLQVRDGRVSVAFYSHSNKLGGIQTIDVRDPAHPVRVGGFETGDSGIGVEVRGNLAYVAFMNPYTFLGGLHIADLSDPGGAIRLGSFYTFLDPQAMVLEDRYVYVADGATGLRIVDVTDAAAPVEAATCPSHGTAHDVALGPGRAYVADGAGGLRIVDIADPRTPVEIGAWTPADADVLSVVLDGAVVFVADRKRGLLALDVASPGEPVLLSEMPLPDVANGLALTGRRLYAAAGASGLQIIDVRDPLRPRVIGGRGLNGNSGYFFDVAVEGDRAYVADLLNGLVVIDVGRPESPALAGGADLPGVTASVAIDAGIAVAGGDHGVSVLEPSAGGGLVPTGGLPTTAPVLGIAASEGRAFAAAGTEGLLVIDLSDTRRPAVVATGDTPGEAQAIALAPGRAFVADGSRGLTIFDLANPAAPAPLGSLDTQGTSRGLAVAGSLVYVADDFRGLLVVDAAVPSAPALLGRLDTPGRASGVAVSGGYAYVADLNRGVQVVDVTQPSAPRQVRNLATPGAASGVAIAGTRLLVANGFAGVLEYDLTRPDAPTLTGVYNTPGIATGVAVPSSDSAPILVGDGPRGVRAVRLNPALAAAVPDAGGAGLRQDIPAGFAPGPYDVQLTGADGTPIGEPVRNGFVVCGAASLQARLTPSRLPSEMGPTPSPWSLQIEGDAAFFDPAPRHEARLLLPALGTAPKFRFDAGREAIDITVVGGAAIVRLSGSDRAAMQAIWDAAVAQGGFPLPRLDARAYGPLRLGVHPGNGSGGPRRWRFELPSGILTRAEAWGHDAGLEFEVTGTDALGCDARAADSL